MSFTFYDQLKITLAILTPVFFIVVYGVFLDHSPIAFCITVPLDEGREQERSYAIFLSGPPENLEDEDLLEEG